MTLHAPSGTERPNITRAAGRARVAVRSGVHRAAANPARLPALAGQLSRPYLEMSAWPGAVPCARHHAREILRGASLKELIEPAELVVSEMVTNAIQACGGLDGDAEAVVRLWLVIVDHGVLVMVWDASPSRPQPQSAEPEAESGRGLLLVDALSDSWGSFELADEPGKVVWALCAT